MSLLFVKGQLCEAGKSTKLVFTVPWSPEVPLNCTQVVVQVWPSFYSINQTDQMLAHLQSFSSVPEHFTLPDSTKSGVPLFYIPPGSTTPVSGTGSPLPLLPPQTELNSHSTWIPEPHLVSFPSLRHLSQKPQLHL